MSEQLTYDLIVEKLEKEMALFRVDSSALLIRYMDYSKFLSLLEYKSIFLTRADRFEDPLEGTVPDWYLDKRTNLFSPEFAKRFGVDEEHKKQLRNRIINEYELKKQRTFISCWNLSEVESYALWQIYAKNNGVAIKTSASKLDELIKNTKAKLYKVRYMSNEEYVVFPKISERSYDFYTNDNIYVLKNKHYEYEQEVRVILINEDTETEDNLLPIPNLSDFIEEILVSPFAPDWFFNLVKKQVNQTYKLDIPVTKSQIKIGIHI